MHIILIAWLYVILMLSISYWPDVVAMLWRFALFGIVPAFLWFKMVMFVRRRPDDQAISGSPSGRNPPADDKKKNAAHH